MRERRLSETFGMGRLVLTVEPRRGEQTLLALGREEVEEILREQRAVEVDCGLCNRHYRFGPVDVHGLFADGVKARVRPAVALTLRR